ncbi:MAG TPA: chitobiase/beta-hexosaminidase C-terminal domain-containing protein, partial [Chthoniobacteraceae bacterium]|nr:chitobiase/beta-hexosaminidase C-terminal domain-containing protein [Chthoniobacteraceae bacterium]
MFGAAAAFVALCAPPVSADIVINEVMAAASARLLQHDSAGVPQVGTGTRWYQPGFDDAGWESGPGPFGYGTVAGIPAAIATRLATSVQYLTPTVYFRRSFTVTPADQARADQVQLVVAYNDGFVAYLNGVEVARRNGGPVNKFIYHDQPAYNREVFSGTQAIPTSATIETISIGLANARLVAGENVLAIHALNADAFDSTLYIKADLRVSAAPEVTFVNYNDTWKYFPGVVEPSGNVYDPGLLSSGKLVAPWARLTFDDATWASGPGPIGCGTPPAGVLLGTSLTNQVIGATPSFYTRAVFAVSAAEAAETEALQLIVRYDDGFVAYLNGVEVARRRVGLPNTFTPHDAVADGASSATETITIDPPAKLLVPGSNVLAIQVHNVGINDPDLLIKADLRTTGPSNRFLVSNLDTWKYFPGTVEPVPQPSGEEENSVPEGPDSAVDWIELHNNGTEPVSLAGWSITDAANNPRKWVFPDVSIAAGGYLLLIADGLDIANPPANGFLHTNFSLDADGEFVGLFNQAGAPISFIAPSFGKQSPFHSYARDSAGNYRLSDTPTPNAANAGNFFNGVVATPSVSVPGRFYTGVINVTLSCATPGATIRYTTDGRDPDATSLEAIGPLSITKNTALRARAFLPGAVPSEIITHTYIINEVAARRSLPAICLTGDNSLQFYRPFGIMAIVGGSYNNGVWFQNGSPLAYNAPMQSGKPAERPISFELLHDNATPDLRTNAGIRTAGSPYSRPRYSLSAQNSGSPNTISPWPSSDTQKPQFNIFFRDDIGSKPENYPLVPLSSVRQYDNIRLRSGKNEIGNTFIRDEFTRRLFVQMGHVTVLGDFVNIYVNGVFKGYFNICERPREPFFQQARRSDLGFDVRYITALTDGDTLAYNEMMAFARSNNMANLANYQALQTRVDVTNFADYILLHIYAGVWDWPQ